MIKKGKSAVVEATLTFTQRSTSLSKLILFSSTTCRDFVSISASSEQKIFGMHPYLLPTVNDSGKEIPSEEEKALYCVPRVLVALKNKLISLGGLYEVGC